jgi:hypothetical protein
MSGYFSYLYLMWVGSIPMHFRHIIPYKSITYQHIMLTNSVSGLSLAVSLPFDKEEVRQGQRGCGLSCSRLSASQGKKGIASQNVLPFLDRIPLRRPRAARK